MYSDPTVRNVVDVSRDLGFELNTEEAEVYCRHLKRSLLEAETFMQARARECRPPVAWSNRGQGYRPSQTEDPLNVWMWKCRFSASGAVASRGALTGKTVAFKDHIAVAGLPISYGCQALEGLVADFDATVVARVLQQGGTVVGKNVMTGLSGGLGGGGAIGDFGRPLNPHNARHVTGGSSSGSAAAVAAREVDISFGGDQGGSIRVPAAFCGAVGLKPTFGMVSHFGIGFGTDQSIDHVGPIARTVEDVAAALQATAGYDPYDPRQRREVPSQLDFSRELTRGIRRIRVGVLDEGFVGADPGVGDMVSEAVEVLAGAGAEVLRVSVPGHAAMYAPQAALRAEGALAVFKTGFFGIGSHGYYPRHMVSTINRLWESQATALSPEIKMSLILGEFLRRVYRGEAYAKSQNVRHEYANMYDRALVNVDVLVMPTVSTIAPEIRDYENYLEAVEDDLLRGGDRFRNTVPFNYTGHPALALPVGKSHGLPVSMQIVGRHFEDALVLRVGYAFQHAIDWDSLVGLDQPSQRPFVK